MNTKAATVGGFILGALALAVGGILFFGGMRFFTASSHVVVFFAEPIAGLDVGSPVTFNGVRVGSVQGITIRFSTDTMTARIPVYLELESTKFIMERTGFSASAADYDALVRAGLRAQLALQSFVTGQLRVDLDFRPGAPAPLVGTIKDVPEIPTVSSELSQLRNQLEELPLRELAGSAKEAFASLARVSDRIDTMLDPIAKGMLRAVDAATQTLQSTEESISRVRADASMTLHKLDSLIADGRRQLDARGGDLSRTLASANRTLAVADRAIGQAETLLGSLNELAEPRSPFRGDLEAAVRDLAASASSLRSFAETVERNPNSLFMGRASR